MRIGVLTADDGYEAARVRPGSGIDIFRHSLARHEKTVRAVREALEGDGHTVVAIPVSAGFLSALADARPRLVFNTYFGPARRQDQASIASFLEYAGVPFTGGGAACHFAGLSKPLSKRLLNEASIPTPGGFVVDAPADAAHALETSGMGFPLIVKPAGEGEGIGLDERSVVRSKPELAEAVGRVTARFRSPALVEEFLPGRELTVGVLGGRVPRVLPILEVMLGREQANTFHVKAGDAVEMVCPADLPAPQAARIGDLALRAGRAIGCRDYWRVDIRMDERAAPRVLEVNTLPGLQPGYSDITRMAEPAGMSYGALVRAILESALGSLDES